MNNYRRILGIILASLLGVISISCQKDKAEPAVATATTNIQSFAVAGVIKELKPLEKTVVIKHDAITNYMVAMTMPFTVRETNQLKNLQAGDQIAFQLHVTTDKSWIDNVIKTGRTLETLPPIAGTPSNSVVTLTNTHPLLDYKFTNEFGQPVSFNDFKGKAIAFTFFFTRCPIPEYCPRLMKNFVQASEKLQALPGAPTNWHFLAISFDTTFDTPAVLRNYAHHYQYDSNHWSFLTGAPNKIAELANASGVTYEADGVFFNHNFRTLVVDAAGQLQMSFPIGGDLSDMLVGEIIKAAAVTNR